MKARILAVVLAGLVVSAGAVKVTYELEIPPGTKARQVATEMVAAIPPVVWATAALRKSILDGETSQTLLVQQQLALAEALRRHDESKTTAIQVWRKGDRVLLDLDPWD